MVPAEIKDVDWEGTLGGTRRHGNGAIWTHDKGCCWSSPAAATARDQVRWGGYGHSTIAVLNVCIRGLAAMMYRCSPTNRVSRYGLDRNDGDVLRLAVHLCGVARNLLMMRRKNVICWHRTELLLLGRLIVEAKGSPSGRIDVINCLLLACIHLKDSTLHQVHVAWMLRPVFWRMMSLRRRLLLMVVIYLLLLEVIW